jgi:hypothetical protein
MPLTHAIREYDFQDQVAPGLNDHDGACLGLVANWLEEKKNTSNGIRRLVPERLGGKKRKRAFYGPVSGEQKGEVLQQALKVQRLLYEKFHKKSDSDSKRRTFMLLGLEIDEVNTQVANSAFEPTVDLCVSFQKATTYLLQGRGVAVSASVQGPHSIGIYRSHGGNIHVFDPNFGVFKVADVVRFFESMRQEYIGLGVTFEFNLVSEKFLYIL